MTEFRQLGYVVEDLDHALGHWVDVVGVAPFFVYRDVTLADCFFEGAPVELTLSVAFAQAGPVQVELIEHVRGAPSPYAVASPREVHHVAVWTAAFDTEVEAFRRRGYVEQMWGNSSGRPDERFVYFRPDGQGPVLELVEVLASRAERYGRIADAARAYDGRHPVRDASLLG